MIFHEPVAAYAGKPPIHVEVAGEQTARGVFRIIPRAAQIHMTGLAGVSVPVGQVGGVPAVDGG